MIVYLIRGVETRRCKIGISKHLESRLQKLQTGSAERFEVVATAESDEARTIEQSLHAEYEQYRLHGEWFECPDDVVSAIAEKLRSAHRPQQMSLSDLNPEPEQIESANCPHCIHIVCSDCRVALEWQRRDQAAVRQTRLYLAAMKETGNPGWLDLSLRAQQQISDPALCSQLREDIFAAMEDGSRGRAA